MIPVFGFRVNPLGSVPERIENETLSPLTEGVTENDRPESSE